MNCPFCGSPDTRVVDSRDTEGKDAVRRRRECVACGQRFTTYEKTEEIPITVVKRDGSTELFHPDKLLRGLMRACTKRNVPTSRLEEIVGDIELSSVCVRWILWPTCASPRCTSSLRTSRSSRQN
jgi:transcriptional repressor NrdR